MPTDSNTGNFPVRTNGHTTYRAASFVGAATTVRSRASRMETGRSGRTRTCKAVRRWFPKPEGFHLPAYTSTEIREVLALRGTHTD
jgi:hypothetical protein